MDKNKMRHLIATIVIIGFMLIIGIVIIYPLIAGLTGYGGENGNDENMKIWVTFIDKTASLFTGIVGVIIGYYFGNSSSR